MLISHHDRIVSDIGLSELPHLRVRLSRRERDRTRKHRLLNCSTVDLGKWAGVSIKSDSQVLVTCLAERVGEDESFALIDTDWATGIVVNGRAHRGAENRCDVTFIENWLSQARRCHLRNDAGHWVGCRRLTVRRRCARTRVVRFATRAQSKHHDDNGPSQHANRLPEPKGCVHHSDRQLSVHRTDAAAGME